MRENVGRCKPGLDIVRPGEEFGREIPEHLLHLGILDERAKSAIPLRLCPQLEDVHVHRFSPVFTQQTTLAASRGF
jgi:hypothetical protein